MSDFHNYRHPYNINPEYSQKVAYFCMEYGINQALKIYSGGLGFLAGSHMRSAYALKQQVVGIGILWKYGYYDQTRQGDRTMKADFIEKHYSFLEDTGIQFSININRHPVQVKVWYLAPEVFKTAPIFLLSTNVPENDWLAQTTSHRLYDSNVETKISQGMLLGAGGARLLEIIGYEPEAYHLNEAHALPAAFYLYEKFRDKQALKERLVFTTHTPVEAGNEKHDIRLLDKMGFFGSLSMQEAKDLTGMESDTFNHSLAALRLSAKSNGVSKLHGKVSRTMWGGYSNICEIDHITNAQNQAYWQDSVLKSALDKHDDEALWERKRRLKEKLFEVVADQTGQLFDPDVLTIVWARRFAAYKRADLITRDTERFERLIRDTKRPIQIIWAGKPYPTDYSAVSVFNGLVHLSRQYANCAVLVGYELWLSKMLKEGSDIWLNNPRVPREASGTSGMTAAMNGGVNFSTIDGWVPEFAKHGKNAFVVPQADSNWPEYEQDAYDGKNLLDVLEEEILPLYYGDKQGWLEVVKNSMKDVVPYFDSDRMAAEYYEKLYSAVKALSSFTVG